MIMFQVSYESHGKLINLCLMMLIGMVLRPVSCKRSWGHDLLIHPQADINSYQLTLLGECVS